jgi:hypothetical protein
MRTSEFLAAERRPPDMATETIDSWPLDSIFELGASGKYYPVHLELVDIGDGVQKFALVSELQYQILEVD